jgi:hypothetical protein
LTALGDRDPNKGGKEKGMFFEAAKKKKTPQATHANHTGRSRQPGSARAS